MSCAGIRRQEFIRQKPLKGVAWAEGPIGNATWTGVKLSDVLKAVGVKSEAKHVWFEGADLITEGGTHFPSARRFLSANLLKKTHQCLPRCWRLR